MKHVGWEFQKRTYRNPDEKTLIVESMTNEGWEYVSLQPSKTAGCIDLTFRRRKPSDQ